MDDSCAVCAEALEWVAYGPCGHREVCSTCVVRLRFVLQDRRCCICKTECESVFVTKAMGDYTRVVTDFSLFAPGANEGKVGQYWYHEDTQAYFDDGEHYKMIRAMCRLSCSVCDNSLEEHAGPAAPSKRRNRFRSIEQLKGHLFHQHRLYMCTLCLEGRKVFICEQKLYTRSQLNQHIKSGDSEVDGSEIERSGFTGHPMCEFCKTPFYGDNELYMHMSTEHYTCHICQRQHPGQYDYFRNYDDLEIHFRQEHFLCEDEACLVKKFIVFQSEAELKRHNAIEHGGNMSRAQRSAALQIPTSFRYRRSEQEQRRGRGRGRNFRPEPSGDQLSSPVQGSLASAGHGSTSQADVVTGLLESVNISSGPGRSAQNQGSRTDQAVLEQSFFPPLLDQDVPDTRTGSILEDTSFPSLSEREPSRYAQALGRSSRGASRLGDESLFPPLPGTTNRSIASQQGLQSLAKNTLAARLQQRSKGTVKVLNSVRPRLLGNPELVPSSSSSSSQNWPTPDQGLLSTGSASQPRLGTQGTRENGLVPPFSTNSSWHMGSSTRMKHSTSAPNLVNSGLSNQDSPSIASVDGRNQGLHMSSRTMPSVEDVRAANKSLVERMRAALGMDEDKYTSFKEISGEYRQGVINTSEYLSYVEQYGLSHLVLEMAKLLPDPQKQKELSDAYYANLRFSGVQENGGDGTVSFKEGNRKKKGKGKGVDVAEGSSANASLADNFLNTVRKLQSNYKFQEGETEVLSKEGYRTAKSQVQQSAGESSSNSNLGGSETDQNSVSDTSGAKENLGKEGNNKQKKKTSKFLRARLGDSSAAALLNLGRSNVSPERPERESAPAEESQMGLPVRGAWRNGGGQKLFPNAQKDAKK